MAPKVFTKTTKDTNGKLIMEVIMTTKDVTMATKDVTKATKDGTNAK